MQSHSWSLVVTRGHSWSLVVYSWSTRGNSWSTRGHSWSFVVIRGHSCVLLDTIITLAVCRSYVSNLIGRRTINIPEIILGVHGLMGFTVIIAI